MYYCNSTVRNVLLYYYFKMLYVVLPAIQCSKNKLCDRNGKAHQ
jgi:hypothetical protein